MWQLILVQQRLLYYDHLCILFVCLFILFIQKSQVFKQNKHLLTYQFFQQKNKYLTSLVSYNHRKNFMSSSERQFSLLDGTKIKKVNSSTSQKQQPLQSKKDRLSNRDPFQKLKKNATNLFNESLYSDDHFKLQENLLSIKTRKLSICRLKDILQPGTPLFGSQIDRKSCLDSNQTYPHYPNFIAEMHILPFWHYQSLIEPKFVNQKGFYHVVVWKDGRLAKQTIDDMFFYDEPFKKIYSSSTYFHDYVWMHILLKVWAKCKGGYKKLQSAQPFDFIRTFSYPDWKIINPALQDIQQLISNINPIGKRQLLAVAQTKDDKNVGFYGLIPNSTSYLITGHEMEFQAIFIKIKTLNGSKWNGSKSSQASSDPQQEIKLHENEFIMPLKQFLNVFHLIHITSNKFQPKQEVFYSRYTLNLDARDSKAKMILIEVQNPSITTETTMEKQPRQMNFMTNVTIYFPSLKDYDFNNQRSQVQTQDLRIPYCKLMIGKQDQSTNLQASFVQSMKEKMLENQDGDFLYGKSSMQYQWIDGTYFKGYDNTCTFLLKLKPGRYYLRFKMETLRVQYRANINVVSSTHVKISDPKMDKKQQQQFLTQILSSKARLEKRNIGYLNPIKKGSWYICNDDFESIGYGYMVIQTIKTSQYKIQLKVDPKALKMSGYRLKSKKEQNKFNLILKQGQGHTLLLKVQDGFQNSSLRKWPPQGIDIIRIWKK